MTQEQMIAKLETMLEPDRLKHSLGVRDMAVKLAEHYGCDVEKAEIAGILHDCAKDIPKDEAINRCAMAGIKLKDICFVEKGLAHAYLGAHLAKTEFGIEDKEILDAIYYHTTGHDNMPLLTKIIYIADMIEPGRTILGVEQMREMAFADLDAALMSMMDATIRHILNKGCMLDCDTIAARNYLILMKKTQNLKKEMKDASVRCN